MLNPGEDFRTDNLRVIVCASDSDLTFQSNDGILFRLHKANLEVSARGFAPPEFVTSDEIICLMESAQTLELLFQFLLSHPSS